MSFKNLYIFVFYLFTLSSLSIAQNLQSPGIPYIKNYLTGENKIQGKIWQIQQAPNGMLFMVGDMGLLEFDGKEWKNFKGSKGFTRSIQIVNDSLIYTGSDLDYGVWKKTNQTFKYKSLYPFKENNSETVEEFWFTFSFNKGVVFASFNNLYLYTNNQLTKITIPHKITRLFKIDEKIYVLDEMGTLSEFNGIDLISIVNSPQLKSMEVVNLSFINNQLTIFTRQSGIYQLTKNKFKEVNWEISNTIKKNKLFSFNKLNNEYLLLGSILNGLYIIDYNGHIIQHINRQIGLTHNTVLDIFTDAHYNVWLSLDAGISKINLNSRFTYYPDSKDNFGTPKAALLDNNIFYLGTNQGLYTIDWDKLSTKHNNLSFSLIPSSEGQVWTIKSIDENIIVGHDKGLFQLINNKLIPINSEVGVLSVAPYKKEWLLSGNYNGINIYKKQKNSWKFIKKLSGLYGAYQQLLVDNKNHIWGYIPNYGIISFKLNNDFNIVDKFLLKPEDNLNNLNSTLFIKNDTLWFKNLKEIFYYNSSQKKLIKKELKSNNNIEKTELLNTNPLKINDTYTFFPITNGFALYNNHIKLYPISSFPSLIKKVTVFNNSDKLEINKEQKVDIKLNNIRFYFISPNSENSEYNYQFKGEGLNYTGKTNNNTLEFLGLKEGHYQFKVWNDNSKESNEFTFQVKPPWHRTWLAYLIYLLLIISFFFLIRFLHHIRLKRQKKYLLKKQQLSLRIQAEKHRKKLLRKKKEKIEIEKELLLNKVKNKTIELAKSSKKNLNNKRIFTLIKQKLSELESSPSSVKSKLKIAEIKRTLDEFSEKEDQVFEVQINELNKDFIQKLSKEYPQLTQYDLRLATYLKMGMNTKEISEILDILPSSINVSRSRLRKKLNLSTEQDLFEFLNSY